MRKLAGAMVAAVVAVLAFGAIMASSASAFHPQFLTASGQTLLFTGHGSKPVLYGENLGIPATIECELVLIHGFVLHASPLAHLLGLLFEKKCHQKINGGANEECNPLHITTKPILAELGLLNSTTKTVVILLKPGDGTNVFAEFTCGGMKTTVEGVVVGEIPELNAALENQYNTPRTTLEVKFETNPAKSNNQKITTIFLLGSEMTGQELKVSGFFGGKAAQEGIGTLTADGNVTIDTK